MFKFVVKILMQQNNNIQSLSRQSLRLGNSCLRPFLFLIPMVMVQAFDLTSNGSWLMISQCEKTHCGKACPEVRDLRWAVNPKDSETGRQALTVSKGVPWTDSSEKTTPLLCEKHWYTPFITSDGVAISQRYTGSWNLGLAVISEAQQTLLAVGMI